MGMKVKDFVRKDVLEVKCDESLQEVLNKMVEKDTTFAVVRREEKGWKGEICGVITDKEIFSAIASNKDLTKIKAEEFMHACQLTGINPCAQISEEDSIEDAIRVMLLNGVDALLVYGVTGFVGVITSRDILKAYKK